MAPPRERRLPPPLARGQSTVRWVPADQADELHSPWKSGWTIFTEHFRIQTNVPFSQAIAFGRQLESFHDLFFALLADVIESDNRLPLAQDSATRNWLGKKPGLPHQVYYFKNKQEYVDYLSPLQAPTSREAWESTFLPNQARGNGPRLLLPRSRGEINATATLFHEVSHQLLFETAGRNGYNKNVEQLLGLQKASARTSETVEMGTDGTMRVGDS